MVEMKNAEKNYQVDGQPAEVKRNEEKREFFADYSQKLNEMKDSQSKNDEFAMAEIRGKISSADERGTENIFAPGEIFDPYEQMKDIRNGSKEDRKEKLAGFKKKLAYQKKGIIEMQSLLYRKMEQKGIIAPAELMDDISEMKEGYALSEEQKNVFNDAISIFTERHDGIVRNIQQYIMKDGNIDGEDLFEQLFKKAPQGKVEVIVKPITLYFRLSDIRDYAYVESEAYLDGGDIDEDDISNARRSNGVKLSNSYIPGLEHVIALENTSNISQKFVDYISYNTLVHEDQHSFNSLVNSALARSDKNPKSQSFLKKSENDVDGSKRDFDIEIRIQDEICAYFKDGSVKEKIRYTLLNEDTIYEYGFDYKEGKKKKGELFSSEYVELVEAGIVAIFDLQEKGYSTDDAIALLYAENLSDWGKVVERQLGMKKSRHKEKKDRINLVPFKDRLKNNFNKVLKTLFNGR